MSVMLLIAATFLGYAPALRNGFVWDDTALVLRDPLLRSWYLAPAAFQHFLFLDATASAFYRPIQRLSFTLDYQLFGFAKPAGWHFTSILLHACAAAALFYVAQKVLARSALARWPESARRGLALGVAGLWAIHPLHTSAVTYISGRADSLAALGGFLGLGLGLASLEPRRRPWTWQLGAAASFTLALFSKESGVTFLLIWLLVLFWRREKWRVLAAWAAVFLAVGAGYAALRLNAHQVPPPPQPPTPAAIRPILAARAFAEYAALLVAPITLRMERDVSTRPRDNFEATMQNARAREYQTLAGVLLLGGFAAWAWRSVRRAPAVALCLGAFALAYLPISNVVPLNATIAEHWLYVPSAFLFLAAALAFAAWWEAHKQMAAPLRLGLSALLVAWAGLLGARTFIRQEDWRDQRTFIERTIRAGGDSARMFMNLANVESNAGQHARAIELYRAALRRAPEQPIIWLGLARAQLRARDLPAARAALSRAEFSPLLIAECHQLRAVLDHVEHGRDSGESLRQARDAAPDNWSIRKQYVEYLIERGDREEALRELRDFVATHRFRAESWRLLGVLLEAMGEPARARDAYRQAALRDVRDADSQASLQRLQAAQ